MNEKSIGESIGTSVENEQVQSEEYVEQPAPKKTFDIFGKLMVKSGSKDLSEYDNHALNFRKDIHGSRLIRGLEGFMGDLDLAIIDIVVGILGILNDRKGGVHE